MADLNLNAVDVLRKITDIFDRAGDLGITTPKFVNERFRDKLAISYADELEFYKIDPMRVGYLLGNKSRWTQPLCKYMTLHFLRYICEESRKILKPAALRTGMVKRPPLKRGFNVQDLTNPREKPIRLLNYSKTEVSAGRIDSVPRLYIDNARTISIKARVKYPNVSKRRQGVSDAANWKWIDLRWERSGGGYARLMKLPNFQSASSTIGSIRDLDGRIAKFSYCTLANSIKDLAYHALAMINKDQVSDKQTAESAHIFDLANLIQKQTIHFYLAMGQRSEVGDLFSSPPRDEGSPQKARINDGDMEDDVFVILGSYEELADMMARPDLISAAAPASSVDAASIDLYYGTGTSEELHALIFTTYTRPDYESAHLVEWDNGVDFEKAELLTESDLEDLFD